MRRSFTNVIGRQLSDSAWHQVSLPVKQSGFGLGNATLTGAAAFVANILETRNHVLTKLPCSASYLENIESEAVPSSATTLPTITREVIMPFRVLNEAINDAMGQDHQAANTEEEPSMPARKNLQHIFSKALHAEYAKEFLSNIKEAKHMARIHSCAGSVSGAWLFNVPTNDHFILSPNLFRTCCLLRLGLDLPQLPTFCKCRQAIDPTGYHLLTCVHWTAYLTRRHDALLRQLMILSSAAGVKSQNNNLTAFQQIEVGNLRRTDLLLYGMGENATNLHTDVSIGHPCSRSHVDQACRIPGHTLQKINKRKNDKYREECVAIGDRFLPLAFETFGNTTTEALGLLQDLVGKAAEIKSIPFSRLLSYWKRRVSTTLQRENALFILNTSATIYHQLIGTIPLMERIVRMLSLRVFITRSKYYYMSCPYN